MKEKGQLWYHSKGQDTSEKFGSGFADETVCSSLLSGSDVNGVRKWKAE